MEIINIENEEQLKELFKTGVRVGETVVINVGSDLEGTIEVWGKLLVTLGSQCKNITVKAHHHSMVGAEHYVSINIIALNGSIVDASGNATVEAYDEAIVRARWEVSVKAHNKVIVKSSNCHEIVLEDFSTAIVGEHEDFGRPDVVVAPEKAKVIEY